MQILLANHSSYPRLGTVCDEIAEAVRAQEAYRIDLLTDGQSDWTDPFWQLPNRLAGLRLGGAARFPGTDRSYRQPVVEATLRRHGPLVLDGFRHARGAASVDVKPVLPGPCTLARLSQLATTAYREVAALGVGYAAVLAQEVYDLSTAGARIIQIDEPMLLHHPEDVRLLRKLLDPIQTAAGDATELAVTTYWGPASALYAQLSSLPGAVLGMDLCSDPDAAETMAMAGCGKILALGVVDGRSPVLENVDSVALVVDHVLRRYEHDRVYLQPSCGLGGLSVEAARDKLELLAAIRRRVVGQSAG